MHKNAKNHTETIVAAMLLIVVGIMPLVSRMVLRPMPPELFPYFPEDFYPDIFTHWKGLFVLIPAGVIAFSVVSDWLVRGKFSGFREFIKKPHVIFSAVYLAFVLISALTPRYWYTSWLGTHARGEGAFMWLAYFVLFFAAIYFVRELNHARLILYGLAFSSIIMGIIGVGQFLGLDFFGTDFGRWFVTVGGNLFDRRQYIDPVFTMSYGTLFNPNTFGKYTAMLTPVFLLAALTYSGKKWINAIFLLAGVLMLFGVFGSSSLGGLVGIVTASGVLAVTFAFSRGISVKKLALAAGPVIIAMVLAVLFIPPLNYRVNFLFTRMGDAMRAETASVQNYIFSENTMTVVNEYGEVLELTVHGLGVANWLTVRDGAGNEITPASRHMGFAPEGEVRPIVYTFEIPGYRTITLEKFPDSFMYFHATLKPFWLTLFNDRIYGVSLRQELLDLNREVPAWGFEGRETWGSNRGYIWSRSFPLMPRRILLGAGPDTFVQAFPQQDIVSMHRFFAEGPYAIVDKAHNIFIQTWISTGGISAIALFGLFGHYLLTTFFSLMKFRPASKDHEAMQASPRSKSVEAAYGLRLGFLCGISAYIVSGFATDTTVGSTGVFFVLLGVGYGLNFMAAGDKHV